MTVQKQNGQYMTPKKIAVMILDALGYTGTSVLSSTIIEPSFGDGVFLLEIVSRIIKEGKKNKLNKAEIAEIIKNNVYGVEKDASYYQKAISRINEKLVSEGVPLVQCINLTHGDTLQIYKQYEGKFDFVVGNPPFVRIHNFSEKDKAVAKDFQFAGGTTDLYVIFYEMGIKMLNEHGKLGYISPNSFLKNVSQKEFRKYLMTLSCWWQSMTLAHRSYLRAQIHILAFAC